MYMYICDVYMSMDMYMHNRAGLVYMMVIADNMLFNEHKYKIFMLRKPCNKPHKYVDGNMITCCLVTILRRSPPGLGDVNMMNIIQLLLFIS